MASEGLGLNAHLASPWMALHPPAVLLAYRFLWLPVGAAIHGLNAKVAGAAGSLTYSYICENLQCSRDFVPFKQAVMSWTGGSERAHLARVFEQWEVDHFVEMQ